MEVKQRLEELDVRLAGGRGFLWAHGSKGEVPAILGSQQACDQALLAHGQGNGGGWRQQGITACVRRQQDNTF